MRATAAMLAARVLGWGTVGVRGVLRLRLRQAWQTSAS